MINIKIFQVIKYQDKEILILFNKNKELLIHQLIFKNLKLLDIVHINQIKKNSCYMGINYLKILKFKTKNSILDKLTKRNKLNSMIVKLKILLNSILNRIIVYIYRNKLKRNFLDLLS